MADPTMTASPGTLASRAAPFSGITADGIRAEVAECLTSLASPDTDGDAMLKTVNDAHTSLTEALDAVERQLD